MRKLKKVISLTVATAIVSASMNMGNVQAMEAQNMGIQESVQKEVAVSSNGEVVSSDFIIENGVLVKYEGYDEEVIIPEGVTSIGNCAFYMCHGLTSVKIPDTVTSIGDEAFWHCEELSNIEIPDSVSVIGAKAFYSTKWLDTKKEENPLVVVNCMLIAFLLNQDILNQHNYLFFLDIVA